MNKNPTINTNISDDLSIFSNFSDLSSINKYTFKDNTLKINETCVDANKNNCNKKIDKDDKFCNTSINTETISSDKSYTTHTISSDKSSNKSSNTISSDKSSNKSSNTISSDKSSNKSYTTHSISSNKSKDKSFIIEPIINNIELSNKILIDVAVLCHEYTNVEKMCNDQHIINLDEIPITCELFQCIFYPYRENFGLNKDFLLNNIDLFPFISFLPEFRSINHKKFYLLEEIISNIETDLNVSRICFTKESLVELTNEMINLKSLLNLNCCSVLASLTWTNILEIIENYKLINQCDKKIIPILVVNVSFKTPTPGVKNTIVRFQYKISNI